MSSAIAIGVAGVGVSAYGANQQAGAASDAAAAQEQQAMMGLQDQQRQQRIANIKARPFEESGYNALAQLNYLMGLGDPTAVAKTEANFDPQAFRNWLIERKAQNLADVKDPAQRERRLQKATAQIDAELEKVGAWKMYNQRQNQGLPLEGDYWKKRTQDMGGNGQGDYYGQLQQRFNNQLFEKDPGYDWRMKEGQRAVEGTAAARGGLLSGAALKAMERYGQGFASEEFNQAYNRFTADQANRYNRLSNIAGLGQQQIGQQQNLAQNYANTRANLYGAAGEARASGIMGGSNARQSGYAQAGNMLMDTWANWQANRQQEQNDLNRYRSTYSGDIGSPSYDPATGLYR